jgi:hypothetical protein
MGLLGVPSMCVGGSVIRGVCDSVVTVVGNGFTLFELDIYNRWSSVYGITVYFSLP